jgi:hypothetical protein
VAQDQNGSFRDATDDDSFDQSTIDQSILDRSKLDGWRPTAYAIGAKSRDAHHFPRSRGRAPGI